MPAKASRAAAPLQRNFHIDKRAASLLAASAAVPMTLDKRSDALLAVSAGDNVMLSTRQLADWLGVSTQWIELIRHNGSGPPYQRLGPRLLRYSVGDVRKWLAERASTGGGA